MITLQPVQQAEKVLLFDLLQAYLREMSPFYGDEPDSDGLFPYPYFDAYFREEDRHALFILQDSAVAGFALVNPYSFLGQQPDHVIAEFSVLPDYRRRQVAAAAFRLLMQQFPGQWEIKYHVKNLPAAKFWTKMTAPFGPSVYPLGADEQVLAFDVPSAGCKFL